jgi:hypothetical protein
MRPDREPHLQRVTQIQRPMGPTKYLDPTSWLVLIHQLDTPMHWKHDILSPKSDHSPSHQSFSFKLMFVVQIFIPLSFPIRNYGLAQAMDTTSASPASARVTSPLCLISFQSMASSSRPWELNSCS